MCSLNTANITFSSVEILHYNTFVRYHFIFVHKIGPDTKICETVTDFSESPKNLSDWSWEHNYDYTAQMQIPSLNSIVVAEISEQIASHQLIGLH